MTERLIECLDLGIGSYQNNNDRKGRIHFEFAYVLTTKCLEGIEMIKFLALRLFE